MDKLITGNGWTSEADALNGIDTDTLGQNTNDHQGYDIPDENEDDNEDDSEDEDDHQEQQVTLIQKSFNNMDIVEQFCLIYL